MSGSQQASVLLKEPGSEWIPVEPAPASPAQASEVREEPATPAIDFEALEGEVETLLGGYRDVLHHAANLPLLGTVGNGRHQDGRRRWWGGQRAVCRPLVRRLSEQHVRKRMQTLLQRLHVHALGLPATSGPGKRLRAIITRVERAHHDLFGEGALRRFARRGWLPVLAVAGTSAATLLSGGQTSSLSVALPLAARRKVEEQAADPVFGEGAVTPAGQYVDLPDVAFFVLNALLLAALLAPLLVRWGFWAKRSLLLGGPDATWEVRRSRKPLFGFAVPARSCYAQEGRVFGLLGARRPREFPADALLGLWTMVFLWFAAGMALYAWWDGIHNPADVEGDVVALWTFIVAAGLSTLSGFVAAVRRWRDGTC